MEWLTAVLAERVERVTLHSCDPEMHGHCELDLHVDAVTARADGCVIVLTIYPQDVTGNFKQDINWIALWDGDELLGRFRMDRYRLDKRNGGEIRISLR